MGIDELKNTLANNVNNGFYDDVDEDRISDDKRIADGS